MPIEKLKNRLGVAACEKDKALRGIKIAAIIFEAFSIIDVEPILVGGGAVAFYTNGKYTTADIDMIAPSGKEIEQIMLALGFNKLGKDFTNRKLRIYCEFPSDSLGPTEKFDIIKIDKTRLKIISIEDLIVDRLAAYKFWKSSIDGVNALMMLELGIADKERIETRAKEEDVLDALDYVEASMEKIIRKKLNPVEASALLEKFIKRRQRR